MQLLRVLGLSLLLLIQPIGGVMGARPGDVVRDVGARHLTRLATICDSVSEIPAAECEALVSLYQSTAGDGWTDHSGWLTTVTPCSWYGVSCTSGHVATLYLEGNELNGSLPAALSNLTRLQQLYLWDNQLTGSIPPAIGTLASLQWLDLSDNQLSGGIPSELGNLPSLQWGLDLSFNQLTGTIPSTLGNLNNLQYLHLSGNRLSGPIPATLGNLATLTSLRLAQNALEGEIPPAISGLVSLMGMSGSVDLGYNRLSSSDPGVLFFLEMTDPDWAQTQTVPPANLHAVTASSASVELGWTPILYTGDGGYYEISYATDIGGPFIVHGNTISKAASSYTASGLPVAPIYYLRARTYTPLHGSQQNALWSAYSDVVMVTIAAPFSLPLVAGWNLISLPPVLPSSVLTEALSTIDGHYDLVYAYDASAPSNPWRKYNVAMPPFLNTLHDIDETMGVWLRATSAVTLTVTGTMPLSTTIPLYTGWNLVGYPCTTTQPITQALATITGKYDLIYAYEAADALTPWRKYNTAMPPFLNTLTALRPGWGYWIRATTDCFWVVDPN